MRLLLLFLFFLVNPLLFLAQEDQFVDSIKRKLKTTTDDSVKVWLYLEISDHYNDPKDWLPWNEKAHDLAEKNIKISKGSRLKYFYFIKANTLGNQGYYYDYIGDKQKTVKSYFDALELYDKTDSLSGKAALYSNLGVLYTNQGDYKEAREFLTKALELKKKSAPWDLSKNYNNLGVLYFNLGETTKALKHYELALESAKKSKNSFDIATALNNIGNLHYRGNKYSQSIPFFKNAVDQSFLAGDSISAAYYMCNLGKSYLDLKKIDSASFYFFSAERISKQSDYIELKHAVAQNLHNFYSFLGDYQKALEYYKLAVKLENDMSDLSEQKESLKVKLNYDHKIDLAKKEMQANEQERRSRLQIYFVSAILFLILILALVIYSRFRNAQKQKKIIEKQNVILELQHKEITDSINYALNLQKAILPNEKDLFHSFEDGFVFFRPKDIVSGDFYWSHKSSNHHFIAVADCTGHGVPGAMVSLVCYNALNNVILSEPDISANELLNHVRAQVVNHFSGSAFTAKDGMDISVVRKSLNEYDLQFAGANHNCVIFESDQEIIIKGDRQPIGVADSYPDFTNHLINPQNDKWIYLFSDGVTDQFGGENGKKLKLRPFLDQLKKLQYLNGDRQLIEIEKFCESWANGYSQTDDICIIGFKYAGKK